MPLNLLLQGFGIALMAVFLGAFIGTVIGVLPGPGPTATIALLLPITVGMDMVTALIVMAGKYYGAMYGGSITSILVNIPGDAARLSPVSTATRWRVRAGPALGMSATGSFIGGTVSVVAVMLISPFLAETALKFGAPEMFAPLFFAFICIGGLTGKSRLQGLLMACVGLLLGTVGTDEIQGVDRFVFGTLYLQDGIGLIPLAMGLFGLGEILYHIEKRQSIGEVLGTPKGLMPTLKDWKDSAWPIIRDSFLGFRTGIIAG